MTSVLSETREGSDEATQGREAKLDIRWKEDAKLQPCPGHGIDFVPHSESGPTGDVIAVIRGFDWCDRGGVLVISIRPPDDRYDAAFLDEAKKDIVAYLEEDRLGPPRRISPRLWALVNA